ncbi:MAG: hypothetical protein AVDCRST_MAG64-670, partial [uncultured Phycisphaerae bacterium]
AVRRARRAARAGGPVRVPDPPAGRDARDDPAPRNRAGGDGERQPGDAGGGGL